ncbi:MAG: hypothetical protein COA96_04375 [SAR86 cluster bacterium]|uniref:Phage abortive infection protein n=1 Tax=SAR86 cluster bacterium TaxID=2030880 RepID=A0A2A5B680_9GAMM|nr:MAG: hypothetical protein COA96_04375 [SAR86 cluster bacterium]
MFDEDVPNSYYPKDWRILFGLGLTLFWFFFLFIYIARNVGWGSFLDLPIDEMGAFLEGAFAFLAFLWLVIGLFIQQSTLAENNKELRRTNLHSEKQTQAIAATEMNARQETFFKIADSTRRQLGSIAGLLFLSSQGPVGSSTYSSEDLAEVWTQFASGDVEVFSRLFLTMQGAEPPDFLDLFYGTEIRRRHTENFLVSYDRLCELAKGCDTDNIILDSLIYSAHGLLNIRLRELHPEIKFNPIIGTNSEAYLERIIKSQTETE